MILEPGDVLKDRVVYTTGLPAITINPNTQVPRGFLPRLRLAWRIVVRGGEVGAPIMIVGNYFEAKGIDSPVLVA